MILVCALVGLILCRLFGHLRRDEDRLVFELSVSGKQRLAYAALKEGATTAWRKHRAAIAILAAIVAAVSLIGPTGQGARRTVTGFTWMSAANPAGYRVWTIDGRGQWHEHYPDGHQAKFFDVTTRGTVNGCGGYITKQSATPFPVVFIPDLGCRDMSAPFQWGQSPWAPLGAMTTISTLPPTTPGDITPSVR